MGGYDHGEHVFLSRPLVTAQQRAATNVALLPPRGKDGSQLARILKAKVDALTRERVQIMRGVPHQRNAGGAQLLGPDQA